MKIKNILLSTEMLLLFTSTVFIHAAQESEMETIWRLSGRSTQQAREHALLDLGINIEWPEHLKQLPELERDQRIAQVSAQSAQLKKDLIGRYSPEYTPTQLVLTKIAALQLALSIIYDRRMPFRIRQEIGEKIRVHRSCSKLLQLKGAGVKYADILESVTDTIEQDLPVD